MVTFSVLCQLLFPERTVSFGKYKILATLVRMPETAIDENNCLVLGKHDIRSPDQTLVIDPETKSMAKQVTSYQELTLGILRLMLAMILLRLAREKQSPIESTYKLNPAMAAPRVGESSI